MTEQMPRVGLACLHCTRRDDYRKEALHLVLMSHGVARLEFFCTSCHRQNEQAIEPATGEQLTEHFGVAATFVTVPLEVAERVDDLQGPVVSQTDVDWFAGLSQAVFNRIARRELGLGK